MDWSKGGKCIVVLGQVKDSRPTFDKADTAKTKQTGHAITVVYWGGEDYVKLADATQAAKFKVGDMVRVECDAKEFKENMYAGVGRITHVNEKAVAA